MAMTLFDHQKRLDDLEAALCALVETTASRPAGREQVDETIRRLRARGATGAADLLAGDRVEAAYRR
ncbi:hypothetical protein LJR164_001455 [Phenylobacterium sp. LjRoot164]|uniref:hypothetical protein n=1 Tax=unclassified Phenylobacterium TaxID=2640670 RepID=UPI003ECCDB12